MEDLIHKILNGNTDAYSELINNISSTLYNIARVRLNSIEDAYDAVQETTFKAYKNLKNLENKKAFKSWIIKILINECNNINDTYKKQTKLKKQVKVSSILENKFVDTPIDTLIDDLDFKMKLNILNTDEMTIMLLHYKYMFTTGEIADILNENINTVKSKLLRAREKMAKSLGGVADEA